jgi:hypothetical protein
MNEGSSPIEKTFSLVMRLIVSLLLPGGGLAMILLGLMWGMFWWIATGLVVLADRRGLSGRQPARHALSRRPLPLLIPAAYPSVASSPKNQVKTVGLLVNR